MLRYDRTVCSAHRALRIRIVFLVFLVAVRFPSDAQVPVKITICRGDSVLLSVGTVDPDIDTFTWYKGAQVIEHAPGASIFIADTGNYSVIAYSRGGCESPESNVISVRWKELIAVNDEAYTDPQAPVSIPVLANDREGCAEMDSATIAIVNQPVAGNVSVLPGKIVYTPLRGFGGTDSLSYTVKDKSGNVSNIAEAYIHVGSDPDIAPDNVVIYPNPVSDFLYIKGDASKIESIMLITDRGRRLYQVKPFSNVTVINVKEYDQAIYFVRILYKNGKQHSFKVLRVD